MNPTTPSTNLQPHSCCFCNRIILVRHCDGNYVEANLDYDQVLQGARSGCALLQGRLDRLHSSPCYWECSAPKLQCYTMRDDEDLIFLEFYWEGIQTVDSEDQSDSLQIFAPEGTLAHRYLKHQPLNMEPASRENVAWMKRHLDNCRRHHPCRRLREVHHSLAMPSRLINVGSSSDPLVHISATRLPMMECYAIASYAWGSGVIHAIKTTTSNLQQRMVEGIQLSEMPKTIQDLVQVTRLLGLEYLWVDCLCVVQDDDDEITQEMGRMANYYQRTEILLSAATAEHSDEGFLKVRHADQVYGAIFEIPYRLDLNGEDEQGAVLLCEKPLYNNSKEEPLHKRIWTHQEHILASRVLSFGSKQVRWECRRGIAVDGGSCWSPVDDPAVAEACISSGSLKPAEYARGYKLQEILDSWTETVEAYSSRDYTNKSDRLPAFAAMTSLLASATGWLVSDCYAGIWQGDARRQLLWSKTETQDLGQYDQPSWSWASLPGSVEYSTISRLDWSGDSLKIVAFKPQLHGGILLEIRGFIRQAFWNGLYIQQLSNETSSPDAQGIFLMEPELRWDVLLPPQPVWLLEMVYAYRVPESLGLVLVRSTRNLEHFERRGYFELNYSETGNSSLSEAGEKGRLKLIAEPNWIQRGRYQSVFIE
ncbi:heterokaryon incompatibility protein-domain-containing protein [Dactylonectria macrodidyma]|uniref:Heterokaryon incompatibility protein-domain-containing protein n=1 Tax=Dactylonectria macrodidyma TaxID=307937 RepID=A0A9P9DSY5_9HYPO|nr:heterokaryon incompatibility protein-domain-containing protein [Dactylonectria macrodidyma]